MSDDSTKLPDPPPAVPVSEWRTALAEAMAAIDARLTKLEQRGHGAVKDWVRREMDLAACGVHEDERRKRNP